MIIRFLHMSYEKNGHYIRSDWVADNAAEKWVREYAHTDKKIIVRETQIPVNSNPNGRGTIRAFTLNGFETLRVD